MAGTRITDDGKSGVKIEKQDGAEVKTTEKHSREEKTDGSKGSAEVHVKKVEIKKFR